ncbi:MAG: Txe/YoeB family addiction module toxin [Coriobacteriales bacterium]|jgi:Txe/YoeB family toxin of toxin-antitoxin system|nr:Txe/YoeB family addiction module toxin [Coriobacteriales bacterium]
MAYRVVIKNSAKADLRKIKQSKLKERFLQIVETLRTDPYAPSDQFEKLVPYNEGRYSRRLSYQHRIVYKVDENAKKVQIYAAWSHYEN